MKESLVKLQFYVQYILEYIEEICEYCDDFNVGQKYALVDLLETIQVNSNHQELIYLGLNWRIEDKYKL